MSKLMVLRLVLSALLGFSIFNPCAAELQRFQHAAKGNGSLSFLVVGDWGRRGAYNQSHVALQMGIIGEKLDIDFVISTGDNFYENGLMGVDDPAFVESFTKIYTAPSLQKQWYSEIADFFFVDTTPFVDKYFKEKDHKYDWSGIVPRKSYLLNLLKDLDKSLKESTARWKIVVGHHTIKSAGHHGNTQELNLQLLPILVENNVDLYINGHDHCLEHISCSESELQFLTSGGGSKAWRGDVDWWNPKEMKFYYDGQGFMSVEITETQVDVVFYGVSGHIMHKWSRNKHPYSIV
ncbi:purple acid phosphatase 3 isoform X2 [Manihot esculenta]|uniref:purple acid phosphatase 3 isoform X2 n=1 Tax=Manihot esculenta TaxID=3983 RepID=UPI001CC64BC3|nr:purple acid phosphatase 3 isoform X2 [Manihot esculenta]